MVGQAGGQVLHRASLDDEALAHVYMAHRTASTWRIDGALEALCPVLGLLIGKYRGFESEWVIWGILGQNRYRGSVSAASVLAELRAYQNGASDLVEPEK